MVRAGTGQCGFYAMENCIVLKDMRLKPSLILSLLESDLWVVSRFNLKVD